MESTLPVPFNRRITSLLFATLITLAMLLTAWQKNTSNELLLAVPFSLLAYTLLFSIGRQPLATRLSRWSNHNLGRSLLLPGALVILLYLYVYLGHGNPLHGNSWQIPLLFCVPVLFYGWFIGSGSTITWKDAVGAVLCILPFALHDYPFNSDLPLGGGGIEDLYLILAIIIAVYTLVVIRRLQHVGFSLNISLSSLRIVMATWAILFLIILVLGLPTGLVWWSGYPPISSAVLVAALGLFLRTYFGTALPEELLFRGTFLNLLHQRIVQTNHWRRYLFGALILLPVSLLAGYTTNDKAQWFPLLCALLLWGITYRLNQRQPDHAPFYTAQLIVSTLFGLAHYHIHSTLFMGLAMIAGWGYAYVYRKTGSVFYSALTHTLVNTAPALFGLSLLH